MGLHVTAIKIDPYLNIDSGTMSPFEHGECYVLKDGGETDLDLGNYERFVGLELTKNHNITTGKIYARVLRKERKGKYLGKTVQIVPHVTEEIQEWIQGVARIPVSGNEQPEVCVIEVGGTIGDIETAPFIEALRQMRVSNKKDMCFVHVSMIIHTGKELKTKPTQHSVALLRSLGIPPNFLVLRTPKMLDVKLKRKLTIFCDIPETHIISNVDVPNIYYVPEIFLKQDICKMICAELGMNVEFNHELNDYYKILSHYKTDPPTVSVTIAGKYVKFNDTYLSLIRALDHAEFAVGVRVNIAWLDTELLDDKEITDNKEIYSMLENSVGIIIPGGFGSRGVAGMLKVARYGREHKIPTLGLCLGMQVMVCEYARSVGIPGSSTEWDPDTKHPIIDILPDQTGLMGGTLRLGNHTTVLDPDSKIYKIYKKEEIVERHRHRYEVNNRYANRLSKAGLSFVGVDKDNQLMEIMELPGHPFYIGTQYHPEYKSRYNEPHPLFVAFIKSCA